MTLMSDESSLVSKRKFSGFRSLILLKMKRYAPVNNVVCVAVVNSLQDLLKDICSILLGKVLFFNDAIEKLATSADSKISLK